MGESFQVIFNSLGSNVINDDGVTKVYYNVNWGLERKSNFTLGIKLYKIE